MTEAHSSQQQAGQPEAERASTWTVGPEPGVNVQSLNPHSPAPWQASSSEAVPPRDLSLQRGPSVQMPELMWGISHSHCHTCALYWSSLIHFWMGAGEFNRA